MKGVYLKIQSDTLLAVVPWKSFHDVVEFSKKAEALKKQEEVKVEEKKAQTSSQFNSNFSNCFLSLIANLCQYLQEPIQGHLSAVSDRLLYTFITVSSKAYFGHRCHECGGLGNIKRYCPNFLSTGQLTNQKASTTLVLVGYGGEKLNKILWIL